MSSNPSWSDNALFRSLNMAFRAAEMPAWNDITVYDVGRSVALWVSAFEILAHPGPEGDTSMRQVYELIERAPWCLQASTCADYEAFAGRSRPRFVPHFSFRPPTKLVACQRSPNLFAFRSSCCEYVTHAD